MNVDFTPDQQSLVQRAIESGRFRRPEDAAQEAFSLWAERERRRSEILAAVNDAEASLAQGEGRRITTQEESRRLANDIAQRGKARLAADKPTTR
jgi:Arc/MetJ-type ribon-helix-helix transcriptional regulator